MDVRLMACLQRKLKIRIASYRIISFVQTILKGKTKENCMLSTKFNDSMRKWPPTWDPTIDRIEIWSIARIVCNSWFDHMQFLLGFFTRIGKQCDIKSVNYIKRIIISPHQTYIHQMLNDRRVRDEISSLNLTLCSIYYTLYSNATCIQHIARPQRNLVNCTHLTICMHAICGLFFLGFFTSICEHCTHHVVVSLIYLHFTSKVRSTK